MVFLLVPCSVRVWPCSFSPLLNLHCLLVAYYVISATRPVSRFMYEFKDRSCSYLRIGKMRFVFSHVEYCDMHFVYVFCNCIALAAFEEYRKRFPDRRITSSRLLHVFTRHCMTPVVFQVLKCAQKERS